MINRQIDPEWPRLGILVLTLLILAAGSTVGTSIAFAKDRPSEDRKVVWELVTKGELPAPVQRAAIEPADGTVYLATLGNLYAVKDGVVRPVTEPPASDAQLGLAPGGGLYAWLVPAEGQAPLWEIYLRDVSTGAQVQLKPQEAPNGFGGLYLGHRGKLIVTVSAIDDWRGIRGRYRFTFWSRDGQALKKIVRPTREIGIVAVDGSSLLLLGEKEATAYSAEGEKLWGIEGSFRKGAITKDGGLALLNPSEIKQINQVVIFDGSDRTQVREMPTPVHHLVLSPDGSAAVIGGDQGRYFFFDPSGGRFKEGERLPFDRELFITDLEFMDRDTLAIGVLQRHGDPPKHTWPMGGMTVVTRGGEVLFRREFQIEEPYASRPAVDVAFGQNAVIGFTMDTTVRVELGR